MTSDLKDQIHVLMERGVQRVGTADFAGQCADVSAFPPERLGTGLRSGRTVTIAAAAVAIACAAGLVAAQLGNAASPARSGSAKVPGVLTAAMLRHVTSATRLALAHSGRAVVSSSETLGGVPQQTRTDDITFDGRNWNDSFTVVMPATSGQPASRESGINRVVNGQAYGYFVAAHGLAWHHETGPHAVASLDIPDPRVLLRELAPSARFAKGGTRVLEGVTVTRLTATKTTGLPALNSPKIWPAGRISALTVWVDRAGIVRQVTVTGIHTVKVGRLVQRMTKRHEEPRRLLAGIRELEKRAHLLPAQGMGREKFSLLGRELRGHRLEIFLTQASVTTMTIRFTGIAQPQVIRAPAHAIPTYARG